MTLNFEIEKVVRELKKRKPKKVLVQLPEGIKQKAIEISETIENLGIEVIFSGETSWGACSIAVQEAEALQVDLIVHFGHAKFIDTDFPILYIEVKDELIFNEVVKQEYQQPDDKLGLNNMTCLYIEDQVDSQILFKVQMKGLKDIKYAVSFEETLPLLDTEQFDFIVMDINLQGEYNGLDALKIIHKMQGYEDIPIIAVTAYVLPGDKEKFIATGFNDFIAKPIFREKMIESLEKIFLQKV